MSTFKKVTREEKIQKLVETHDVYYDIQITIK
jgi:beta-galactosidase beta subunit